MFLTKIEMSFKPSIFELSMDKCVFWNSLVCWKSLSYNTINKVHFSSILLSILLKKKNIHVLTIFSPTKNLNFLLMNWIKKSRSQSWKRRNEFSFLSFRFSSFLQSFPVGNRWWKIPLVSRLSRHIKSHGVVFFISVNNPVSKRDSIADFGPHPAVREPELSARPRGMIYCRNKSH